MYRRNSLRHRKLRITKGKVGVKHGSTLLGNIGPGDGSFFKHVIYKTNIGPRALAGGVQIIKAQAQTDETCEVGDIIKYVNICLQCSPRGADSTNIKDDSGWLEWAIFWQRESTATLTVANIGTDTLGVLSGRAYRENSIMSGCFPVGSRQSMSQDLHIKIPQRCCKLKVGDQLQIMCYLRGSSSTDTRTDSNRLLVSSQFKSYS